MKFTKGSAGERGRGAGHKRGRGFQVVEWMKGLELGLTPLKIVMSEWKMKDEVMRTKAFGQA